MPQELVRENTQPLSEWECYGKQEDKTKFPLSGNGARHSQHRVVVVVGQPANQWVAREGHPQQAKSS